MSLYMQLSGRQVKIYSKLPIATFLFEEIQIRQMEMKFVHDLAHCNFGSMLTFYRSDAGCA